MEIIYLFISAPQLGILKVKAKRGNGKYCSYFLHAEIEIFEGS